MSSSIAAPTMTEAISVSQSLSKMAFTQDLKKFIKINRDTWVNFGKKSSHTLRNHIMALFKKEDMSGEAIFMVYYFHSVVKDVGRILSAMETLPSDIQSRDWFKDVKKFLQNRMTKYVSNETSEKFASVHLPATNPGLDLLCAAYSEKKPETKEELEACVKRIIGRGTFAQLSLTPALQEENKMHVQVFWNSTVTKEKVKETRKRRGAKAEEEGFQEAYYNTSAADTYSLIDLNLKEVLPKQGVGYTRDEITIWFLSVQEFELSEISDLMGVTSSSQSSEMDISEKKMIEDSEEAIQRMERDVRDRENEIVIMERDLRGMPERTPEEKKDRGMKRTLIDAKRAELEKRERDLDEMSNHLASRKGLYEKRLGKAK